MVNKTQTPICGIMFAMNDVFILKKKKKKKEKTFQNIHTLYELTKCCL